MVEMANYQHLRSWAHSLQEEVKLLRGAGQEERTDEKTAEESPEGTRAGNPTCGGTIGDVMGLAREDHDSHFQLVYQHHSARSVRSRTDGRLCVVTPAIKTPLHLSSPARAPHSSWYRSRWYCCE
jgi:hypothetical protein